MSREWRVFGVVFAAGLMCLAGSTVAQQASPRSAAERNSAARQSVNKGASQVDPAVESWVQTLAANIADRHDSIRTSARLGMLALGQQAVPTLEKVARGSDGAAAEAARHLLAHIEHQGAHGKNHHGFAGPGWAHFHHQHGRAFAGWHEHGFHHALAGHHHGHFVAALHELKLTEKQEAKVADIRRSYRHKSQEQWHQMIEAQKKLRGEMINELKGVLTNEQFQQLETAVHHAPHQAVPSH